MAIDPIDLRASTRDCVITAPSETERHYDMVVQLPQLKAHPAYVLIPWLRITASVKTDEICISAGIRGHRLPGVGTEDHDDGA